MKILLASTTALFLTVMPAHAQLIGGGGLGGGLGGSLGGTLGGAGSIGSVGSPIETVGTATRGTAKSTARTSGSQSVDRKSGAVHADRSADGNVTGTATQMVSAPTQMMSGTGSANAAGRANGSSDAQLIGTDAVNQASASALETTRGTVSGTASGAGMAVRTTTGGMASAGRQAADGMSSKAMGSAPGNGSGMFSGAMGQLAAAGSLAAAGNGNFAVSRGMPVLGPDGNRLGKVRSVIADTRGQVQAVLVKVDGASTTLPAANFSGSGNALVSAMGKSQIKQKSATK